MSTDHFVRLPVGIHLLDMTATQLKVLLAMAAHANWKTGRLRIKHGTIAAEVDCSRESVTRSIQRLIEAGLVVDLGRTGRSNGYRIVLEWQAADHIRCDEPITSDVTTPSHLQNKKDSDESVSNNSSLSDSTPSAPAGPIQTESAQALVERELGGELIEVQPHGDSAEISGRDERIVGQSRLTESQAREKFNPDHYNPKQAAAEMDALHQALDSAVGDTETSPVVAAEVGQVINQAKMAALGRARTSRPIKFPTTFHPAAVGYTEQMFKSEFSLLDYAETLNSFIAHHMSKGDTSENWLGRFLTYAHIGQRKRAEERLTSGDNEPPVNRAASWDGKRKEMFKQMANPGEGYSAWQARMEREGVTLP